MNGLFRRRDLPHLDVPDGIYFATFCLAGSLPARGMRASRRTQSHQACQSPAGGSLHARQAGNASANFVAFDRMLDASSGVRWLAERRLADVVRQGILHGQGSRYELFAYVVMPNHCHIVFAPLSDRIGRRPAREAILQGLKRHTAFHCNRLLGRRGPVWQAESYERLVRGPGALERVIDYVERNPVRAGLCIQPADWEFSSAHARPQVSEAGIPQVAAAVRTPARIPQVENPRPQVPTPGACATLGNSSPTTSAPPLGAGDQPRRRRHPWVQVTNHNGPPPVGAGF